MDISAKIKDLKEQNKAYEKEIDKILSKRSTGSRARAAYELWLKINPRVHVSFDDGASGWLPAQSVDRLTKEKVKLLRESQANKYGTNQSESMRHGLEMPPALLHFIQLFHPDAFDDDDFAKDRFRKLMRAFPEFRVMEKI